MAEPDHRRRATGANVNAPTLHLRVPEAPFFLLAAAIVATVLGMAVAAFRGDGSALNSYLFLDLGLPHESAARIERTLVVVVLLASIAAAVWRRWPLWLPAAAYVLVEVVARLHVQGEAYSDWVFMTHAARYTAPLAMIMLLLGAARGPVHHSGWTRAARWALRFALAAVFASHGFEALRANPAFIDLIISSAMNLAGTRISEGTARAILEFVGIADVVAAGALVLWLHPAVLGWAAFWGAVTAFSRVTAGGWGAYPDVLVRSSYFLGPLVLWALLAPARGTAALHTATGEPETISG